MIKKAKKSEIYECETTFMSLEGCLGGCLVGCGLIGDVKLIICDNGN